MSEPAAAPRVSKDRLRERAASAVGPLSTGIALIALVAVFTEAFTASGSPVLKQVVATALVNLVLVVGLYIFAGNSGIFSFGNLAFAAIGAYTAGILTIPPKSVGDLTGKDVLLPALPHALARAHTGSVVATLAAGAMGMAVAAVVALPLMRLSGIAASLATFAVLIIEYVVSNNWHSITNGTSGFAGVPITTTTTTALLWSFVVIVVALAFQQTPWCSRLRASREDEVAARSIGVGIYNERRIAFVLSAGCTAIGGALYGQLIGSFTADAFYLSLTFTIVAMLVVGGMTSLTGAVVGTIFLSAVAEGLRRLEQDVGRPGLQQVGFAAILLAALVWRPRGIALGRELVWPTRRRARTTARQADES